MWRKQRKSGKNKVKVAKVTTWKQQMFPTSKQKMDSWVGSFQ
jgi:hypothetical protein